MRFNHWFSSRLGRSKNSSASASTGAIIAVAGVALALAVMELSIAVASGFKHEIERKIIGFEAFISVLPPYDYHKSEVEPMMVPDEKITEIISATIPQARIVPSLSRQAVLKTDSNFMAVRCVSFDKGHDWSFEQGNMTVGTIGDSMADDEMVISETIARQLGIDTASRPYLYFFVDGKPKVRRASVSGIYNSNFSDFDKSVIYVPMSTLSQLGENQSEVSQISLEGIDAKDVGEIVGLSEKLQSAFIESYRRGEIAEVHPVTNVAERGAVYFSWLGLLDTNVIVILILMACVAAFTLISSLFIIILDRINTIGILRSLGASKARVSRIFLIVAMRIVGLGMIIGNIIGLGIIFIQKAARIIPLNPEMYYLDSVPVEISWWAVAALNLGVAVFAWLILILPARLATRIDPASTMRYE